LAAAITTVAPSGAPKTLMGFRNPRASALGY
jgi:hypothetical protein